MSKPEKIRALNRKISQIFLGILLFLPIFFGVSLAYSEFVLDVVPAQAETVLVPRLEVPIPGLDLNSYAVTRDHEKVNFPWIGAYFAGLYRYAISASLVAAAMMIAYGGFKYILGASMGEIQSGKETINNALVGLLLVMCIYVILAAINPATLQPKAMSIELTRKDAMAITLGSMVTTKESTALPLTPSGEMPTGNAAQQQDSAALAAAGQQPAPAGGGGQQPGGSTPAPPPSPPPAGGDCPFDLPEIKPDKDGVLMNKERSLKFLKQAIPMVKGNTFVARLKSAADLAVKCKITLGPCGNNAMSLWAMAGAGPSDCLLQSGLCYTPAKTMMAKGFLVNTGLNVKQSDFWGLHCNNDCAKSSQPKAMQEKAERSDCKGSQSEAVIAAQGMLTGSIPGYPDKFLDTLQAGDWLYDFNANKDCAGMHSIIFIEWKNSNGVARVVGGDMKHNMRYSDVCFKQSCGARWLPLIAINRPSPSIISQPSSEQ